MSPTSTRPPLPLGRPALNTAAAAVLLLLANTPASASTFGSLANFDAVNDTGHEAYGFEIEFEDVNFYKSGVGSVFGLNRTFSSVSNNPLDVVRFGVAKVEDYNDALGHHAGVRISYGASFDTLANRWVFDRTRFTPTNSMGYNTPGESCWPGANRNWTANPCDHYGVTTNGSPAKTTYHWLVETAPQSGVMTRQVAGIPAVDFVYQPAAPAAPAVVQVRIQAVAEPVEQPEGAEVLPPERLWGQAFWVKTYTTKVKNYIDLGNLLRGDAAMEAAEVESEWSILQNAPRVRDREVDGPGANEVKEVEIDLDPDKGDKAIMRRYEFYKYTGPFNADGSGEVMCDGADPLAFGHACDNPFGDGQVANINDLGNFVGAQMAGFNADQVVAVPEPQSWALMLAGLVAIGSLARRRRG